MVVLHQLTAESVAFPSIIRTHDIHALALVVILSRRIERPNDTDNLASVRGIIRQRSERVRVVKAHTASNELLHCLIPFIELDRSHSVTHA